MKRIHKISLLVAVTVLGAGATLASVHARSSEPVVATAAHAVSDTEVCRYSADYVVLHSDTLGLSANAVARIESKRAASQNELNRLKATYKTAVAEHGKDSPQTAAAKAALVELISSLQASVEAELSETQLAALTALREAA